MKTKASQPCIGTPVRFFGRIYVIIGMNYLGDYDVLRFDADRRVWQKTSISREPLDPDHPHYWQPVAPQLTKRLRKSILNSERLHPRLTVRFKAARCWRRARCWRGILRRFFRHVQNPERLHR